MSGIALEIVDTGLTDALLKIEGIEHAPTGELMEGIGRLVQGQTRRRIQSEKTSPAGAAWRPNRAGTSILYQSGALARSIDYAAGDDSVQVGSALIYAGVHQDGATIRPKNAKRLAFHAGGNLVFAMKVEIPARPFVGLSTANRSEIVETAEEWMGRLLQ